MKPGVKSRNGCYRSHPGCTVSLCSELSMFYPFTSVMVIRSRPSGMYQDESPSMSFGHQPLLHSLMIHASKLPLEEMALHRDKFKARTATALALLLFLYVYVFDSQTHNVYSPTTAGVSPNSTRANATVSVLYCEPNETTSAPSNLMLVTLLSTVTHNTFSETLLLTATGTKSSISYQILAEGFGKSAAERIEWLMYVLPSRFHYSSTPTYDFHTGGSMPTPSSSSLSFPSKASSHLLDFDNIHLLATSDHNGLNTGAPCIRVHEWSIRLLSRVLGYPVYHTEVDLGAHPDQQVMSVIFNETEIAGHVVYRPRTWYKA